MKQRTLADDLPDGEWVVTSADGSRCLAAPLAATPDELGANWCDGRVRPPLAVDWNGRRFGDARVAGSSCIAERRAIELIDEGAPKTPCMSFGDTVRMEATLPVGRPLFGVIEHKVIRS